VHCALPTSDLIISDVTAGLILLRRFQQLRQKHLVSQVVQFSFTQLCTLSVLSVVLLMSRTFATLLHGFVLTNKRQFVYSEKYMHNVIDGSYVVFCLHQLF